MALAEFKQQPHKVHFRFKADGIDFKVTSFDLFEGLNNPGYVHATLVHDNTSIDVDGMIGKKATFQYPQGAGDAFQFQKFHGVVRQFEQTGTSDDAAFYEATIVPRIWTLSLTHRSRVHVTDQSQGITVVEQIFNLLQDHNLHTTAKVRTGLAFPKYSFLNQYRESDLDFLHRLIEEEGIGYFVDHDGDEDQLFFFDSNGVLSSCAPFDEVLVRRASGSLMDTFEEIEEFTLRRQMSYGTVESRDFDFKDAIRRKKGFKTRVLDKDNEFYQYPAHFEDQESSADRMLTTSIIRGEEFEANSIAATGRGDYRNLRAGRKFRTRHLMNDAMSREWICTSVHHRGEETELEDAAGAPMGTGGMGYGMTFTCIPSEITYRPPRLTPKPLVRGSQTATVVGPKGEEIHTDNFGRIKVHMHWDRQPQQDAASSGSPPKHNYDDKSSFWVRVSQQAAGKGWGIFSLPRIGQEVLIDFLEGNPDRPVVVGVMHNDFQRTPYKLPDHKTRTLIKTNSTPGGKGFNEIRFEDKKGQEQIFEHAERNLDIRVKNNCMETIVANRHLSVGTEKYGGDQKEKVWGYKHLQIHKDQYETIEGNWHLQVGAGKDGNWLTTCDGVLQQIIKKDVLQFYEADYYREVKGNSMIHVDGNHSVTINGDHLENIGGKCHFFSGKDIVLQASQGITLKVGGNFVKIDPMGVTIVGTMVKINSGGAPGETTLAAKPVIDKYTQTAPEDPTPADNDVTGDKSLLPSPPE